MPLASLGLPVFDVLQAKCQAHSQTFDLMISCVQFFCREKVVVILGDVNNWKAFANPGSMGTGWGRRLFYRIPNLGSSRRFSQARAGRFTCLSTTPELTRRDILSVRDVDMFCFHESLIKPLWARNWFIWPANSSWQLFVNQSHGALEAISTCLSTTSLALSLWSATCIVTGHEGLRVHIGRGWSRNPGKGNAVNIHTLDYGIVLCTSCLRIFEDHWQHCNIQECYLTPLKRDVYLIP